MLDSSSATAVIGGLRLESQHLIALPPFGVVRRKNLSQRDRVTAYRKTLITLSLHCHHWAKNLECLLWVGKRLTSIRIRHRKADVEVSLPESCHSSLRADDPKLK